jgi:hypothetical protein
MESHLFLFALSHAFSVPGYSCKRNYRTAPYRFPWRELFQPKQPFVIAAFHRREAAEAPLALKTKGAGEPVINDRPITLRGVALGSPRLLSGLCQVIVDDVIIPTPRRHYYHRGSTFLTAWRRLQKGHKND